MKSFFIACAGAASLALSYPAAAQVAVPKNGCVKPDEFPGRLASENAKKSWTKSLDIYGECIKKFAAEQRQVADAAIKAGNEAVDEYNAIVTKAREAVDKANQ